MGCGASKKAAAVYEAPIIASGPSWIQRKNGISIEEAMVRLRKEMEIKASLSDEELLGVARQQRGLPDVEGSLREKVYIVATEFDIWTGWDTDSCDVWVGSIPSNQATKGKLKAVFERYGRVINVTVRYKPRSALNPDNNKSWAVLTFADKSQSSRAVRAETFVKDDEGQPHQLKVAPQEVEHNRAVRGNDDRPGKMEAMVQLQQKEVEKRLGKGGGPKQGARTSGRDAGATTRGTGKPSGAAKRQKKVQELRQALERKGLDTSGGLEALEARLQTAVEVEGVSAGGGISGGFTYEHSCTVWVGRIPIDFVECPTDVAERKFKQLFEPYGKVLSVSTRKKPDPQDNFKSWGLVTFADKKDAKKVLRSEVLVPPDPGGERKTDSQLLTKLANVDEELAKPSTGSLAVMWKSQEKRIAAANKIQAAVRARKAKQKARGSKEDERRRHLGLLPGAR